MLLILAKQERKSNIELLRILAMALIVMSHFAVHSGFVFATADWSWKRLFIQCTALGSVGVDIFVLISGFFLSQQSFRLQKFCRLMGQIWFYLLAVLLVAWLTGFSPVTKTLLRQSLLPLWLVHWFAYVYIILYLLFSFINRAISAFSEPLLRKLLFLLTVLWSLMPFLLHSDMGYSILGWFIYLYLLGAYFRLYPERSGALSKHALPITLAGLALLIGRFAVLDLIVAYKGVPQPIDFSGLEPNVPYILMMSVGLFLWLKKRPIKTIPWVNQIAATMFGVYLIHDHPLVREWLWKTFFHNADRIGSNTFFLVWIIEIIFVLTICGFFDYLRQRFFEKALFAYANPFIQRLEMRFFGIK